MDDLPRPVVGWPTSDWRWAGGAPLPLGEPGRLPPPKPDRRERRLGLGEVGRLLGLERAPLLRAGE